MCYNILQDIMLRGPEQLNKPESIDPADMFDYFSQAVLLYTEERRKIKAPITQSYAQMLLSRGKVRIFSPASYEGSDDMPKREQILDNLVLHADDLSECFRIARELKNTQEENERQEILKALLQKTPILHGRPATNLTKSPHLETLRTILHNRRKGERNKQIAEQYGIPLPAVDNYASSLLQLNLIEPLPHLSGRTPQTQIVYDHAKDELIRNPTAAYQQVADALSKKLGKIITIGQVRDVIYHQRQEKKDSVKKKKEPAEVRLAEIRKALQELQGENSNQAVETKDLAKKIGLSQGRTRELRLVLRKQRT